MITKVELETIPGFDIPKRELSDEEAARPVTLERFQAFHHEAGEDFCDTVGNVNHNILGGFLMAKYPTKSKDILAVCNATYGSAIDYQELYENDAHCDKFYTDFAEFVNLTGALKKRVNQVLIQVDEYYNPKAAASSQTSNQ